MRYDIRKWIITIAIIIIGISNIWFSFNVVPCTTIEPNSLSSSSSLPSSSSSSRAKNYNKGNSRKKKYNDDDDDDDDEIVIHDDKIKNNDEAYSCLKEYQRTFSSQQMDGLTTEDLRRSRAWIGNEQRLSYFIQKLQQSTSLSSFPQQQQGKEVEDPTIITPVNILVIGGSISLGHGIEPNTAKYANKLEEWMNAYFPIPTTTTTTNMVQPKHTVFHRSAHGADMCSLAKRIDVMLTKLYDDNDENIQQQQEQQQQQFHFTHPDLIILEFGINDYIGQDHIINLDHKTDVFFHGFEEKVTCTEAVIVKLLQKYTFLPKPTNGDEQRQQQQQQQRQKEQQQSLSNTAILFLEFPSGILTRKTAQLLHMGVAQHYQIPVISYSETMIPGYYQLFESLRRYPYFSRRIDDTVLPFPHGCLAECNVTTMTEKYRSAGCISLCELAEYSGLPVVTTTTSSSSLNQRMNKNNNQDMVHRQSSCPKRKEDYPFGREPCYLSMFAHDPIHPSLIGHSIAYNLIIYSIATLQYDMCQNSYQPSDHIRPPEGINFLASSEELSKLTDFYYVRDTMNIFPPTKPLVARNYSSGFRLYGDAGAERRGWICTNENGGDYIEFHLTGLTHGCHIIYLAFLKSYMGMGTFTVQVHDLIFTDHSFSIELDGLWKSKISVPADIALLPSERNQTCTSGKCRIRIITHPKHNNRSGNKVKIMTLSVRACQVSDFSLVKEAV